MSKKCNAAFVLILVAVRLFLVSKIGGARAVSEKCNGAFVLILVATKLILVCNIGGARE